MQRIGRDARRTAFDIRVKAVGDDQTGIRWQNVNRKRSIDGPQELVAELEIAMPFCVGPEVCQTRLAFDNPELAFGTQRHDVDT